MIVEHQFVVLTQDLPADGLQAGDVGTVVHVHPNEGGFEIEFVALTGQTIAVATVLPHQLRPANRRDVTHVRQLA